MSNTQNNPADRRLAPVDWYATVTRVNAMKPEDVAAAIVASHPAEVDTGKCYIADALAMDLLHGRHEKREIVNLLRWVLMGCPSHTDKALPQAGRKEDSL